MQVQELMTREVHACRPEDHLNRAAQILWEQDCGFVPVVDGERRVVGVLTDRDICMAAYTQDRPLSVLPVADVMSRDVGCCRPEDPVARAESVMRERHVRRVPVLDGEGKLAGILSLNDIARRAGGGVGGEELVRTLAAVSTPWCELEKHREREARSPSKPPVLVPARAK